MASSGYYVAPFAPDGEHLGVGFWEFSKLSQMWIDNCHGFMASCPQTKSVSWGQQLARFETQLTSARGAGLATFSVDGLIALSCVFASGIDRETDDEVLRQFVASMQRVEFVRQAATVADPFGSLLRLEERPLAGVVVWHPAGITDEDHQVLQELSNHFAAAFFLVNQTG
jgi:hypothetical protein